MMFCVIKKKKMQNRYYQAAINIIDSVSFNV
jgi:hypothetical protein